MTNRELLFNARSYDEWINSIVRCRDCKHATDNNLDYYPIWCNALLCEQELDGFCDAGEKR